MTVGRSPLGGGQALAADEIGIAISVEDTGMGIAGDALASLFSEFEQADAAVSRRQGGTGLGLAISRRLARAMGGDIFVVSAAGAGSTFTTVFRLKRATQSGDGRRAGPAPAGTRHVLLALDREIERRALRLSLEGANIPLEDGPCAAAPGLIDAAAAAGEPFTTVLVDGHSGRAAAAELLASARAATGAPVQGIVVLDTGAKTEFSVFRDAGFDAYLVRPIRPQSVLIHAGVRAAEPEPEPVVTPKSPLRVARPASAPLVLLVEDNDINALLATRMLEKSGCEVRLAVNGREAVEAVRRVLAGLDRPHDIVLMDAHMPVLDGLEATRAIKELYGAAGNSGHAMPPIIAVTANAFDEDRRRCLEAGMDDYLAKPFTREELQAVLERWCPEAGHGTPRAA